ESRSETTAADSTVPYWAKSVRKPSEVVEYASPPTYRLDAMGPLLDPAVAGLNSFRLVNTPRRRGRTLRWRGQSEGASARRTRKPAEYAREDGRRCAPQQRVRDRLTRSRPAPRTQCTRYEPAATSPFRSRRGAGGRRGPAPEYELDDARVDGLLLNVREASQEPEHPRVVG